MICDMAPKAQASTEEENNLGLCSRVDNSNSQRHTVNLLELGGLSPFDVPRQSSKSHA
jgi:hypothetical protein